jgi:thymidylate kinase
MTKTIRYIAFDGPDGLGKTTQLNLLRMRLAERGLGIHNTKLLGGDGTDDYQNAMRKILLHSKFPKNSVELEEQMFALTDLEGISAAKSYLSTEVQGVVLKDRAISSHIAYALAKGMSMQQIEACHRDVILAEKELARKFGAVHIILIPDNVNWLVKRIASRNAVDGTEIVERLENLETQQKVVDAMRAMPLQMVLKGIELETVFVLEGDTIADVQKKVDNALSKYSF